MNITTADRLAVVVDYGMGNIRSITKSLEQAGVRWKVGHSAADIGGADRLILPGVGAFADGMKNLHERGLLDALHRAVVEEQTPILGICLGMELLADEGEEGGLTRGLGWIPGRVRRFRDQLGLRIPHIGWNRIRRRNPNPLLAALPDDSTFYFVHSYVMDCAEDMDVSAECEYGERFPAVVARGKIFGCQFHPEKSQRNGRVLLRHFLFADL